MSSPFDFLNSINFTKKDLLEEHPESDYNPFIVNRGLSYFVDTVLYAQEMNMLSALDKKLQYDFYLGSIRTKKRFSKWAKSKKKTQNLQSIMDFYGFSHAKAQVAAKLLTEDQIAAIEKRLETGGVT
jgi:hypothetical protein